MKRSLIVLTVFALLLTVACASTTATSTPTTTGTITAVDGNNLTIKTSTGETSTVTIGSSTVLAWFTGADAYPNDFTVGRRVNVWAAEGSATASRIVLAQ
jgi:ABC-type phosphate transport system substrate-binding protein